MYSKVDSTFSSIEPEAAKTGERSRPDSDGEWERLTSPPNRARFSSWCCSRLNSALAVSASDPAEGELPKGDWFKEATREGCGVRNVDPGRMALDALLAPESWLEAVEHD